MFNYDNIPKTLKQHNQFLNFKIETKENGKPGKPPVNEKGYNINYKDPENWMTFEGAVANYNECEKIDGISFVLSKEDDLVGIDLDDCVNNGSIEDWANDWVQTLDSYTEISPSEKGLRIFVKGEITSNKNKGNIEVYGSNKPLTLTGNHLGSTPIEINVNQEGLDKIMEHFNSSEQHQLQQPQAIITNNLSDELIIEKAKNNSTTGAEFTRLLEQGINDGEDHSELDYWFCKTLAFWSGKNEETIDRIFRTSGLYREKWEIVSYRESTIKKSIKNTLNCYDPDYKTNTSSNGAVNKETFDKNYFESSLYLWVQDTELGVAEKVVKNYGENIKWCEAWKKWLFWNGKYWETDESQQHVLGLVKKTIKELIQYIISKDEQITDDMAKDINRKTKHLNSNKLNNICNLIKAERPVSPEVFDTNSYLLNVKNGTINLETGKLEPHIKTNCITKYIDIDYTPNAKAKRWDEFLKQVMRDKENIEYLKKAVGYSLTGSTEEECLHFLYGSGRNGKTTFTRTIEQILGDYSQKAPVSIVLKKERNNRSASNDIARMKGARFVSTTELSQHQKFEEGLVKDLTSTDTLNGRFLFSEYFEFKPSHKLWMYGNHKPYITGQDEGIWRRIRPIPFTVQIPESKKDTKLSDKLSQELNGILAWAVLGCLQWQQEGLEPTASIKKATEEYREEMRDSVSLFVEDCCVTESNTHAVSSELFESYTVYCEKENLSAMSKKAFGIRLKEEGLENGKVRGVRAWFGIRLSDFREKPSVSEENTKRIRPDYKPSNDGGYYDGNGHVGHVSTINDKNEKESDIHANDASNASNASNSTEEKKEELHKEKAESELFSRESLIIVGGTVVPLDLRNRIRSLEEKYTPHLRMEMLEDIRDWTIDDVLDHKKRLEAYEEAKSHA